MLKIILVFIAFALPSNAYAGSGSGRVTFLLVNHDTTPVWVNFNVENIMNHACATPNSTLGQFVFTVDETGTGRGREMLSLLLSAEARNVPITVRGTGVCVEQNRESIDYLYIGDPAK